MNDNDKMRERLERSDQFLRAFARSGLFDNEATENLWKCIKLNDEVLTSKSIETITDQLVYPSLQ